MEPSESEFRAIVLEHQSMVYSIALRLLGEPGGAEEVAQDVFLELYAALEAIHSTDHLVHWLRRVVVHRATDYRRRRRHRPEAAAGTWTEPWDEGRDWGRDEGRDWGRDWRRGEDRGHHQTSDRRPDQCLAQCLDPCLDRTLDQRLDQCHNWRQAMCGSGGPVAARVEQMLQSLPMPMRTAVVLRFGEEMTPTEIAALLGQPLATVKSNLQRGLVLLRRKAGAALKEYVRV